MGAEAKAKEIEAKAKAAAAEAEAKAKAAKAELEAKARAAMEAAAEKLRNELLAKIWASLPPYIKCPFACAPWSCILYTLPKCCCCCLPDLTVTLLEKLNQISGTEL